MNTVVFDKMSYGLGSQRSYTDEGFLRVSGRVARTGIYTYLARELGMTDRAPNDIVKVYRPPEEVFDMASLESYDNTDITNNHPTELINSETYTKVAKGIVTSTGRQDGDFVVVDMIIKDSQSIKDIESGKVQLSPGYMADYEPAPDGVEYDLVQRNIRINHVAIVTAARGGNQVKLFDEEIKMVKITLDGGKSVELQDGAEATLIADSIERLTKAASDAKADADKAQATADKLTEENEALKAKTGDEAIKSQVTALFDAHKKAAKIAGKTFACDSADVAEIQREALKIARPSVDWAAKSASYVEAAFDMQAEEKEAEDEEEEKASESKKNAATDAAHVPAATNDAKPVLNNMEAWKLRQTKKEA